MQSISYGLDIYDMLQKYYKEVKQEEKTFFIQPLHVLYDHKYLMLQRLLYLNKELKFKIPNDLLEEYFMLFSEVNILRNLGIKYWVSRKVSALDTVISVSYTHLDVYKRQLYGARAVEADKCII